MKKELIYIAAPYSHPNSEVREGRLRMVSYYAFTLHKKGIFAYSPLTHDINLAKFGMGDNFADWEEFDLLMLSKCDKLYVLKFPGWEDSVGVTAEIKKAKELKIPIEEINLDSGIFNTIKNKE